ncbi:threonine synthase-like 1 isoform X2 [Ptychodera flava]|uniref:threonine synthase-like 1 isoform X2 n=1 Tax=Ptychodera flava TaxID=63121 RepID=UPI00396A6D56
MMFTFRIAARHSIAVAVVKSKTHKVTAINARFLFGVTVQGPRTFSIDVKYGKDRNVILMGCPGAGKTTLGRMIAKSLSMPVVDIDDDHLEPSWKTTVGNKLSEVGPERFLQLEGEALLQFNRHKTVISLTGSNPMHQEAMEHISKSGIVVFLDVPLQDILNRLERMKVDRIVGQRPGVSMADILKYRQQFYEKSYDIRVICAENDSLESIADKIMKALERFDDRQGYVSSRNSKNAESDQMNLNQVIRKGLAGDGGLYVPASGIPHLQTTQWNRLISCSYQERALRILEQWINPTDLSHSNLKSMIDSAYDSFNCNKVVPMVHLERNQYLLELFHGPTASFKDAALQLMPQFFREAVKCESTRYLILVATSGDTGSAVLDGFSRYSGDSNQSVMVLFPEDGVSEIQKVQMRATPGDNAHVVGVRGDFDFCQTAIKKIFNDVTLISHLRENYNVKLTAANSINWGRLLPQVVYHASAYLDLVNQNVISVGDPIDICIPTGNFGNIQGAVYAKAMGIPIRRFICASNNNNILTTFLNTGIYDLRNRSLHQTISPAIDILKSSNLERFLHLVTGGDSRTVCQYYKSLETQKYFEVSPEDI